MKEQDILNTHTPEESSGEIDIRQIIYIFLSKWYLFTVSIVLLLAIGWVYLKTQTPIYESKASVLVMTEQNAPEEMFLLQDMGLKMGKNNIDNEIGVFKSPDLIARIVTSLELYTTYRHSARFGFHTPDLYKNSPLYVRMEDVEPEKIPGTIHFVFTPRNGGFRVEADFTQNGVQKSETIQLDTLPGFIQLPIGKFYVAKQTDIEFGTDPLEVTISNAMSVARGLISSLNIVTSTKQSSLLDITLKIENRRKGEDFIQALISEYNLDAVKDKNTVSYNTSVFIEERLKDIARELGEVEGQVEDFRKEYEVSDIQTQVGSYIRKTENYESRRMEIETQLNLVRYIEDFIKNPNNKSKLVPNLGIKDMGLVALINEYNTLLINRERIEGSAAPDNPSLRQINQQVNNMNQNIITSLANEIQASQIALRDLERENTITSSRIRTIPTVDRRYTDILRQQEVKSNLFVYLLQKREETNLTQAAVAPKAKIIAKPYSAGGPVAPKRTMILAIFFMIGVAIPAAILMILDFFQTKINGMKDLEKLTKCSVVGDIIKAEGVENKSTSIVIKPNDDSTVSEMFRTMRNNILFMTTERDYNIILITSTVPKEGKTFISINLARSLSLMDKKVLLVGADLRNPQLSRNLGIPKREIGFSSYLAGHIQDYNELIEKVEPNFFVVQSGPIPPNPNELIAKTKTAEFFNSIRKEFDYIVVDSAPVGVVSDTFMLARYCHATLFVVREGYSEKDTIQFINNLATDKRLKNIGVILNHASFQKSHGRYKYGYKYSYRYRYGYAQGYGNK
jgi:capsular exopolysaccharide synthesis family protein